MPDKLRIAVVDNYPIFREALVRTFRHERNFVVVAEGATAEDTLRFAVENAPDVLLLEAAVPGSLEVVQAILGAHRKVSVVFLASTEDPAHVAQALHAGVQGYIMKGVTGPDLVRAIKAVRRGERYITSELAWHLVRAPVPSAPAINIQAGQDLSIREKQVLDCASKGLSNKETSRALGLAIGTIKYYRTLAFRKLGARNRLEAMVTASEMTVESLLPVRRVAVDPVQGGRQGRDDAPALMWPAQPRTPASRAKGRT